MVFSVSALSYVGPKMRWMNRLPKEIGIEIFWDWGSEDYWKGLVSELMKGRCGNFSIHGPMNCVDVTDPISDEKLFSQLTAPFAVYHQFDSQFYVLHTHSNGKLTPTTTLEEITALKELAFNRIEKFNRICMQEGVQLVIENVGKNALGMTIFEEADFLELFARIPDLKCLLDVGHAVLGDYDIAKIQKTLGNRILAYHLHDNQGSADDHLRIREGVIDWKKWKENCLAYTPEAEIVFEYDCITNTETYVEDVTWIQEGINTKDSKE